MILANIFVVLLTCFALTGYVESNRSSTTVYVTDSTATLASAETTVKISTTTETNSNEINPLTTTTIVCIVISGCGGVALISACIVLIKIIRIRRKRKVGLFEDDDHDVELISQHQSVTDIDNNDGVSLSQSSEASTTFIAMDAMDDHVVAMDTRVSLGDLVMYIRDRKEMEGEESFRREFKSLPYNQSKPWEAASNEKQRPKNRFKDILPFDDNRVKLDVINDDPLTDYINASYIQGFEPSISFIGCIGPTPASKNDFWRMVWEQRVYVVVMVTKLIENGTAKCIQYWPDSGTLEFGAFSIQLLSEDVWPEYVLRKFRMSVADKEMRTLSHFHYTAWPDKGAPNDGMSLVNFRKRVDKAMVPNTPTVVHCSAGVGRTGTYIALDNLLRQAVAEGSVDVFNTVKALRLQRIYMVQTLEQYRFIHDTLASYITVGDTTLSSSRFTSQIAALNEPRPDGPTQMEVIFKALLESSPVIKEHDKAGALSPANRLKNRYHNILPLTSKRIFLRKGSIDANQNYINAVAVDSYQKINAFIATQIPMGKTAEDFWQMVLEQRSQCIVEIYTADQYNEIQPFLPTTEEPVDLDGFSFSLEGEETVNGIEVLSIKMAVTDHMYENVEDMEADNPQYTLKLFQVQLAENTQLLPPKTAVQLYTAVHQWQLHSSDQPVVVTCLNGSTFCGQYLATHNLLSMLNLEQEVNVFQITQQLKRSRPEFINNLDQYQGLHAIVEEYLTLFDNYANFQPPIQPQKQEKEKQDTYANFQPQTQPQPEKEEDKNEDNLTSSNSQPPKAEALESEEDNYANRQSQLCTEPQDIEDEFDVQEA